MKPEFTCWRCARGLNIDTAPKNEAVVVLCPRCKAKNIVRAGAVPCAPLDTPPRRDAQLRQTTA